MSVPEKLKLLNSPNQLRKQESFDYMMCSEKNSDNGNF